MVFFKLSISFFNSFEVIFSTDRTAFCNSFISSPFVSSFSSSNSNNRLCCSFKKDFLLFMTSYLLLISTNSNCSTFNSCFNLSVSLESSDPFILFVKQPAISSNNLILFPNFSSIARFSSVSKSFCSIKRRISSRSSASDISVSLYFNSGKYFRILVFVSKKVLKLS